MIEYNFRACLNRTKPILYIILNIALVLIYIEKVCVWEREKEIIKRETTSFCFNGQRKKKEKKKNKQTNSSTKLI